jgi:hypothetical protein
MGVGSWEKEKVKLIAKRLGFKVEEKVIQRGTQIVVCDEGKKFNINFYNTGRQLEQGDPELLKKFRDEYDRINSNSVITIDLLQYGFADVASLSDLLSAVREVFTQLETVAKKKNSDTNKHGAQLLEAVAQEDRILNLGGVSNGIFNVFKKHFGRSLSSFYSCFRNPIQHNDASEIEKWLTREELELLLAATILFKRLLEKYSSAQNDGA